MAAGVVSLVRGTCDLCVSLCSAHAEDTAGSDFVMWIENGSLFVTIVCTVIATTEERSPRNKRSLVKIRPSTAPTICPLQHRDTIRNGDVHGVWLVPDHRLKATRTEPPLFDDSALVLEVETV